MAKPAIPSDISPEATDFLTRTFEIDHTARPTAAELLQHPFIAVKPGAGPVISAQQAKNAMAAATKTREAMMGGMQSLSALAETK
jgi:mitogen-activated protein kinase kinase kinase